MPRFFFKKAGGEQSGVPPTVGIRLATTSRDVEDVVPYDISRILYKQKEGFRRKGKSSF